ncbi:MAG: arginine deiminase family protein, partial [Planctomycetota bacterium]
MSGELTAILRQPSAQLGDCELVHLERHKIDHDLARQQHRAYREKLAELGLIIRELPALPQHPDAIFVEDCALVLDEVAVLTRPGAPSRRDEVTSLAPVLAEYREVLRVHEPATIDGGDILVHGRTVLLGISQRSNAAGLEQL